jgi:hypothetical protein
LTIDAWEDVKCELFWPFNDDMFTSWIPANHVVVFGTLKKGVKFCQKCSLGLGVRFGEIVVLLLLLLLLLLLWLLMLLLLLLLILLRLWRVRGGIRFWWRIVVWGGIGRRLRGGDETRRIHDCWGGDMILLVRLGVLGTMVV